MEASIPSPANRLLTFWMRGAKSEVGVGTNFRPRDRTSVSGEDRSCPERLMTVLGEVSSLGEGVVFSSGPWKVGEGMSKV